MSHKYNLMAQCFIPEVKKWNKDKGIIGMLSIETYSAEFEFGAMPKALGALITDSEPMVFGSIVVSLPKEAYPSCTEMVETNVRYYVRKSQESTLQAMLQDWKRSKDNFKDWDVSISNDKELCFCIDKGWECLIWNGKLGKRFITEFIEQTTRLLADNPHHTNAKLREKVGLPVNQLLRV